MKGTQREGRVIVIKKNGKGLKISTKKRRKRFA